ncbi:MAG: DUF3303 family protein [Gammaproteobacteria bacterium]|nr:DUF3303 family protein [Gammaproteobacteria bacterium]
MKTYVVIESIRAGQLQAVYARFHQQGRMLPHGLEYIDSWLAADGSRVFQLMRTADVELFDQWTTHWDDLVDFEIVEIGDKPGATE